MNDEMYMEQNIDEVSEDKNCFVNWIKTHKKQLIQAGLSIITVIAIALGLKNKESITELWNYLKSALEKMPLECSIKADNICEQVHSDSVIDVQHSRNYTSPQNQFAVRQHIRDLPEGWCHSGEKAAEAAELGINLLSNQTLVDSYVKGVESVCR